MRQIFFILALLFSLPAAANNVVQNENTRATLLAAQNGVVPGKDIVVGVLLEPRAGWHTYWENPGDAGIPTTLTWTLPKGVSAESILWPLPERIQEGTLAVYGYKGNILLPTTIHIPDDITAALPLRVKAEWLVCDNICVPESAELTLELPITDTPLPSAESARFQAAADAQPRNIDAPLAFSLNAKTIAITLPEETTNATNVLFMPREMNQIQYAAEQKKEGRTLTIVRADNEEAPTTLSGFLIADGKAYQVHAQAGSSLPAAVNPAAHSYPWLLLSALLGGLILNLMPCVLPVLSLKALAIAKKSGHDRHIIVKQALAYTLGVLLSFAAIAGVLIALQMAGASIGWGFQMQSPPFVGFLAILLLLVGLNLAGMFELPVLFGSALSDTPQHGLRGSFFTGVLATAVATPCTAPFMATAVGATLTLSPLLSMGVFLTIGLGLALPFLLIAIFPRLITYMPKPGAWMITFKQLMAFPMFASVIWLLWVLTRQTGDQGLLTLLVTMFSVVFIIWLKGHCRDASFFCRTAVFFLLLAVLVNGLGALGTIKPPSVNAHEDAFSATTLQSLRDAHTPVFVDATAAWCLTCQVNKRTSIDTEKTRAAFAETGTKLLIADWTNRDAEITTFLKTFGYNGVPLYVYYPAQGAPVVLPQILSESLVINTLKGK